MNLIKKRDLIIALLFIAVAAFIRFYDLERQSLWNDEMFSLDVATKPLIAIQEKLVTDYNHPPLFFYLAHTCLFFWGESAWALRFTSVLFGALTVGLVFLFACKLFNLWSGLISGLICLVAPFHLAYSQEGRPYALAAFFCLASFYTLYLLLNERKRYWITLYLLTSVALLYTHHWGVFVLATQIVYVLFFARITSDKKQLCVVLWIIIGLMYLPEFFALRQQIVRSSPEGWFWVDRPNFYEVYHLFTAFSGTYFNMASSIFSMSTFLQIIGVVISVGILIVGIFMILKYKQQNALQYVLIGFGGTLLIPFLISFFKPEVFLWYRYTAIAFPVFCVSIGGVVVDGKLNDWKLVNKIAVGALLIVGMAGAIQYLSFQKGNAKEVAAYVEQVIHDNNIKMIIRPKTFAPLLNHYYKGDAIQHDEVYLDQPLGEIVDTVAAFTYISLDIPSVIRSYMDVHFDKVAERRFSGEAHMGMVVGVYRQKPDVDY